MSFRRIIFWSHLATGCVAGLFVLLMSVTGILLMYEHHLPLAILDSVEVEAPEGAARMTVDELVQTEAVQEAGTNRVSLAFDNRENAPVILQAGRSDAVLLNPFTGTPIENPALSTEDFMHTMMGIHRWLGAEGEARSTARAVTGAANLAFLFLVISGLYLWFPKAMRWTFFKLNLFFRGSYPNAKARDYNWHHVFGFWALIPLFFIVISGVMISYPWASQLIYAAWGEDMPQRGGPPPSGGNGPEAAVTEESVIELMSLQAAVDAAIAEYDGDWKRMSISLPSEPDAETVSLTRDFGNRITPQQRTNLTFDRSAGEITQVREYAENSPALKTRMFLRFIHTGERYGVIGSTIAGIASLAACFLVWTGMALSWRRLVLPAWRRRKAKKA
ncbi:PepSY-associated TM helix domain-containing protein [Ponticaulis sp.]|uniref:PepSY-associated TM helix domain-containing protein n=1 Tax=Ponticaulis sp. TaxID=2020902 RepID=UPI000B644668|nr:PepSY-associated TM helix domain-containing protein [Ponticaulis sp.]MAJ09444.1 hypothetical protein [Ponticaulis sp.]RPG18792.1 MAG: hypothetical protein CBC85_000720 [Hyphomonadaceae bacterium TMED125]|tara:strand:- start:54301 stop:55467 length:1167 start_codon:yes stop_codon:yes gene_type:complete